MSKKNLASGSSFRDKSKLKRFTVGTSCQSNGFPLEISMLLDVFSRIESRRQAKLRTIGEE